jgi:predicted GTPase
MEDQKHDGTVHVEDTIKGAASQRKHVKSVLSVPLQEAIAKQRPQIFTGKTIQLYYFMLVAMMV